MAYEVMLTHDAARDLEDIYTYILLNDTPGKAEHVLTQVENEINSLNEFPLRGVYPNELTQLGIREYREIFYKPYRIIYRVINKKVYIMLIADGRRNMQTLLSKRLLL